jgi:Protein of unknown function (DUF3467)
MAKKRKPQANEAVVVAAPPSELQTLPVRVVIDPSEEAAVYYANYAEVGFGQHEFVVSFARVPAKLNLEQIEEAKGGTLRVEPSVQITIPPTLLPGLIRALSTMKDAYEKAWGVIHEPGAQ